MENHKRLFLGRGVYGFEVCVLWLSEVGGCGFGLGGGEVGVVSLLLCGGGWGVGGVWVDGGRLVLSL